MQITKYLNILINLLIKIHFKDPVRPFCMMQTHDNHTNPLHITTIPTIQTGNIHNLHLDPRQICKNFLIHCKNATFGLKKVETTIKRESKKWYNERKHFVIIDNQKAFDEFFQPTTSALTFVRDVLVIYVFENLQTNETDQTHKTNETNDEQITKFFPKTFRLNLNSLELRLYTHKFVGIDRNNDAILLDVWFPKNESFKYGNELFPDKLTNQQGRVLRAPCMPRLPYANCNIDKPIGNEQNIILEFTKRYNLTIQLFDNVTENFGHIFPNGSRSGYVGSLISDEDEYNDLIYGGSVRFDNLDAVRTVVYSYEVSVPLPKLKYGWFMFLDAFKPSIWILVKSIYIIARILVMLRKKLQISIVSRRCKSEINNISLFGYMINQPSAFTHDIQSSTSLKFFIILILFSGVLINTAYNSRLSSVMISPVFENDINTLKELADSDLKLLFFDKYYAILEKDTREVYKKLMKKIYLIPNNTDFQLSEKLLRSGKYAVARYRRSTGEYYEFLVHLYQMYGRYKPITPELFKNFYSIIARKNSIHGKYLNEFVQTAIEGGLMKFWEEDALRSAGNTIFHHLMQDYKLGTAKIYLNLKHLKGCFGLLFIGMCISTIVFVKELYIAKRCRKNQIMFTH